MGPMRLYLFLFNSSLFSFFLFTVMLLLLYCMVSLRVRYFTVLYGFTLCTLFTVMLLLLIKQPEKYQSLVGLIHVLQIMMLWVHRYEFYLICTMSF